MGVQRMKQDFWIRTIGECKSSGMTVREYCELNGLSEKSYWYYHKKYGDVLEKLMHRNGMDLAYVEKPQFVELHHPEPLPAAPCTSAVLVKDEIRIELTENISDEFLQRLLRSLFNA